MTERQRLTELILNTPKIPFTINGRAQGRTYQTARNIADHILANGYHHVEEIFDEFEKLLKRHCTCLSDWQLFHELKKKYFGGEQT